MSHRDDEETDLAHSANVPQLIDSYKSRRDALRAQSQDLARLQTEIRKAAEREAGELVDTARSDVRRILVNARRELLVLAAQVQAAVDDPATSTSTSERSRALVDAVQGQLVEGSRELEATRNTLLDARHGIHKLIADIKPDLDSLADEARVLRSSIMRSDTPAPVVPFTAPGRAVNREPRPDSPVMSAPAPVDDDRAPAVARREVSPPPEPPHPALRPVSMHHAAPRASLRLFVATFAVLGAAVVIGAAWWLRSADTTTGSAVAQVASRAASPTPPASDEQALLPARPEAREAAAPMAPSLVLEARRDVWVRATIDGRADVGGLMRAGQSRQVTAVQGVVIRAGDAGALWVTRDGGDAAPIGRDGQVVTRRFSFGGAETRAAPTAKPAVAEEPAPIATAPPTTPDAAVPPPSPAPPIVEPAISSLASERELAVAAELWVDAYYRGTPLAAFGTLQQPSVNDERTATEALPPGASNIGRTFDGIRLQLAGDNALYTSRVIERGQVRGRSVQYVSLMSQVWMRRDGTWRLLNVRIVSDASLNRR